jgi:hypothetical protein
MYHNVRDFVRTQMEGAGPVRENSLRKSLPLYLAQSVKVKCTYSQLLRRLRQEDHLSQVIEASFGHIAGPQLQVQHKS